MELSARKLEFIREFLKLENEDILSIMEKLIKINSKTALEPLTIEELNERINVSLEDSYNDRLISTKDLLLEIEKWD